MLDSVCHCLLTINKTDPTIDYANPLREYPSPQGWDDSRAILYLNVKNPTINKFSCISRRFFVSLHYDCIQVQAMSDQ